MGILNDSSEAQPRVVRITNIVPPYRVPLWRALDRLGKVRFETWLMASTERNRQWLLPEEMRTQVRVFSDWGIDLSHRDFIVVHFNPGMLRELARRPPDLVTLGGYESLTCIAAIPLVRKLSVPFIIGVENTRINDTWIGRRAPTLLRKLIGASSAVVVPGRAAQEHAVSLGVHPEKVFIAPNSVDVERFRPATSPQEREELRTSLDLPEGTICLYVGRLEERKGLDILLGAFRNVIPKRSSVYLLIVGDGPLRGDLLRQVAEDALLRERVILLGYCSDSLLPSYYAASDIFVFPTRREVWGMVLNEAMSAGLPVIVSDGAAAAIDLVESGVTGFVFKAGDANALTKLLALLIDDPGLRERVGEKARERILTGFTPDNQAQAIMRVITRVLREAWQGAQEQRSNTD